MGTESPRVGVTGLTAGIMLASVLVTMQCGLGAERDRKGEMLPRSPEQADGWYQRLYQATCWPDTNGCPLLQEHPLYRYQPGHAAGNVLKPGVLPDDWTTKAIRVKDWITEHDDDGRLTYDAYIYRTVWRDRLLHICDTRSSLVVAVGLDRSVPETHARENVQPSELFSIAFPTNMVTVESTTGDVARSFGFFLELKKNMSVTCEFSCVAMLSNANVVVYEFQKNSSGGTARKSDPLFKSASEGLSVVECAVKELQNGKCESNLCQVVVLLENLGGPTTNTPGEGMVANVLVDQARRSGYRQLLRCMETLGTDTQCVALVKTAMRVIPTTGDYEDTRRKMVRLAVAKLSVCQEPSARDELRRLASLGVDAKLSKEVMERAIEAQPDKLRNKWCRSELQGLLLNGGDRNGEILALVQRLWEDANPDTVEVMRLTMEKTKDAQIRKECADYLSQRTGGKDGKEDLRTKTDSGGEK